jgi:hypothetical protein
MVTMGDRAHEAEPEPVARRTAAGFEPDKAVEHDLAIGRCDTRSAIGNLEDGLFAAAEDPELSFPSIGIFEGIIDQVGERLR